MPKIMLRGVVRAAAVACVSAGAFFALGSPAVAAPPGDNGTVKVHRSTTSADDRRNEPQVCRFYLVGFGFDPGQKVSWQIRSWPPTGDRRTVLSDALTLNGDGHGRTADLSLPDGHYKLFWNFDGEKGRAKQKVFWVKCPKETPAPAPSIGVGVPPVSESKPPKPAKPSSTPSPAATTPGSPTATSSPSGDDNGKQTMPPSKNVGNNAPGGSLPFTGSASALLAGIAGLLIVGGGAAVVMSRRRAHR